MLKHLISLILLLALIPQLAWAQFNNPGARPPKNMLGLSIGFKAGTTVFFGDLVDNGRVSWTAAAYTEKAILSWLSWRAELEAGQAKGGQEGHIIFKTTFFDADALAKVAFLDLIQGYRDNRTINPYFALGAGILAYSCTKEPSQSYDYETILANAANPDLTQKWLFYDQGMQITGLATGLIGARYQINNKLWATLEAKGNILFTDNFDGHQGWPNNNGNWIDSQHKCDALWTISLGLQYRFFSQTRFQTSGKYSRANYLHTRKIYERNARRARRL